MGVANRVGTYLSETSTALFRHRVWNLGVVEAPIHAFLRQGNPPPVRWLPDPGPGRFLADPFAVQVNGRTSIVCEEYNYRANKGAIVSLELTGGGVPTKPRPIMMTSVHMSYPFLMVHDSGIFCVPETAQARELVLYRADAFPSRWSRDTVLLRDVAALDATLFQHGGRWWVTYTDRDVGENTHLFVQHAPSLRGPWQPHRGNPVKTDASSARPAGTPSRTEANSIDRPKIVPGSTGSAWSSTRSPN